MNLRKNISCDYSNHCPYEAENISDCEYWCGADETYDCEYWEDDVDECGYNPYTGCYDFDC